MWKSFISFNRLNCAFTLMKYEVLHVIKYQLKYAGVTNNSKSCEKETEVSIIVSKTKFQNWDSEILSDNYTLNKGINLAWWPSTVTET